MEIIKELKSTYLTQSHFSEGLLGALSFLAICIAMSTYYWFSPMGEYLLAKPQLVFGDGQFYRLFTTQFIHGDLNHLLSNSMMLVILSFYVVNFYGLKTFYLYTIFCGALINGLTLLYMKSYVGLLGASGVVYFLWGFWLILYFLIERGVSYNRRVMKIVAISLMMLVPSSFDPQTSYLAHFIGLVTGVLAGLIHYFLNRKKILSFIRYKYILEPSPYLNNEEENYHFQ